VQKSGLNTEACPYHKLVHLDPEGRYRVTSECEDPADMIHKPWFVLPPVMEWYYRQVNPLYKPLPPYKPGCVQNSYNLMELIYPQKNAKIYLPVEMDGSEGKIVLQAAHHNPDAVIYWHIDDKYIGMTNGIHEMAINPGAGNHIITLVDDKGNSLRRRVEILSK
jgi:penicillin-binding protein 1C